MRLLLFFSIIALSACGVKEQADQLQALEQCSYEIVDADSVYIGGVEAARLVDNGRLNLLEAPRIAFAFMQQKIPVRGILQLKITNPGKQDAGIHQFEYQVFIKDVELISGLMNRPISVTANGGSTIVPVKIDKDFYPLLSDADNQKAITDFLDTSTEKTVPVTFKIKPGFLLGSEVINFPDFITIEKQISNSKVLAYIQNQ